MMNFKEYIINDVSEKKILIDLLPQNTQRRKIKYQETIQEIKEKYLTTQSDIKKYIDYKYNKLLPKKQIVNVEQEIRELSKLSKLLIIGNPQTTFFEKMELDILLYDLMHYYDNSLENVNKTIYKFIDTLSNAGIIINLNDYKLNNYSYLYVKTLVEKYHGKSYTLSNDEFGKIYWKCPKVIEYIIINLLIIVRKNEHKLNNFIQSKYKYQLKTYELNDYEEITNKVKQLKQKIIDKTSENEYDIVNLFIDGKLDLNSFKNIKTTEFPYFMLKDINLEDQKETEEFVITINKLKYGLEEYLMYQEYLPVIEDFKKKYTKYIEDSEKNNKNSELKSKKTEIMKLEKLVYNTRVNKYYDTLKSLESNLNNREIDKIFKQEIHLEKLYKLYGELNELYFDNKIKENIRINTSVADVFEIFNSFPYFNKKMIKKVFNLETTDEIEIIRNKINEFIYNPYRKIIDMIPLFVEKNIPQLLMNGYRFENLNITEESFEEENINNIFEKCHRIIRNSKIEKFSLSLDEIEFLVKVTDLKNKNKI